MTSFNRFFIFFFIATLAVFVERGGFLNIYGIVPNLLLMLGVVLIISHEKLSIIISVFFAVLISAFFVDPFWVMEFGILGLIVFFLATIRKRFTGNSMADIFIVMLIGELLFYGAMTLFNFSTFSFIIIAYEFVYTMAIGIPLWFLSKRYI